ncbi:MAG TPA: hypothetical protein VE621_04595 [Bryobacteraceae bacterium]|nr:hypothetical protein [Bryobacteraceae bacterium]
MIFLVVALALTVLVLFFTFRVRPQDLPEVAPPSPAHHLETRKAAIYENLRDLNFEYRVGKLSDADYQRTKTELQTQLAGVLHEIEELSKAATAPAPPAEKERKVAKRKPSFACPHCKASFDKPLKFCGECGKPMAVEAGA